MGIISYLLGKRKSQDASEQDWTDPSVVSRISETYEGYFSGENSAMIAAWTVHSSGRMAYAQRDCGDADSSGRHADSSGAIKPRRLKVAIDILCNEDGDIKPKFHPFLKGVDQRSIMEITDDITQWNKNPKERLQISYNLAEAILARHLVMPDEI